MKTSKMTLIAAIAAFLFIGASCGSKQKNTEDIATEQTSSGAMEIDSLLTNAEPLVNQEVTIEGICTHACKHGATKIFLMGSDDTQTIRVEAGKLGSFDTKCVNSIVQVTGILKEQRIDEAYLQQWETRLRAASNENHGEGEAGCNTEKKARGETANTPQARIADFRSKIAKRQAEEGKSYLSFYYIEALKYEIQ
ncbi:hypothetical protein [Bacteroides helcogenes]|uniref:Lipoprotein n=1 Tax=Bacteroides helcogenes (strain ATCC 35417 / DSM 20613 / JCM 6297 / CCUG 15421 / P 36-108) TaxID=693979 RepID=E6SS31_BACT6|nr:hypothetical protein [Bacteroides helcogenes]ADV43133.1 hypothetical protein Bache_1123 [Bacteroides helcogenes P 36-108]MDY5239111.1 hypothetical protein [Bacteroides helcogenes]